MERFDTYILPRLTDDCIRYQAEETVKSMSVDYFRNSFKDAGAAEHPAEGKQSFYYQNLENPDFIMRFRLSATADLAVTLIGYGDFEKEMKANGWL